VVRHKHSERPIRSRAHNYLELPPAGYVQSLLATGFELEVFKERRVGPPGHDAVTTLTVAKRRSHPRAP
jgi:hypothetical protein